MTIAVLTRPLADCQRLSKLLQDRGISHLTLPIMEVTPLSKSQCLPLPTISPDTIVIFVSANAVRWGLPELKVALDQVDGCQVIAVGQKTRDTLVSAGIEAQIPERADSEGLLQMPALEAVERNDVLIVKGEGGRDLLGKELTARGARVVEWSCYRRVWPDVSLTALDAFAHHALVFQASSGEVLSRLSELLAGAGKRDLFQSTVIVPSERVAALAERSGWRSVVRADDASDRGFLQALQSLRSPA